MEVVITGEGIVSAIGNDKEEVLGALLAKQTGIAAVKYLKTVHRRMPVGEVKMSDEEMKARCGIDSADRVSRTVLMGILAAREAIADARINISTPHTLNSQPSTPNSQPPHTLNIVLISGTTVGGMDLAEDLVAEKGEAQADDLIRQYDCGSSTDLIAAHLTSQLSPLNSQPSPLNISTITISTACSSAANAIMLGARMISNGEADIVVAGGSEALTRFHMNGFNSLMILDSEPCRPFDDTRSGLNLGEGAAYVVMESAEAARRRGAEIHAVVSGYANTCDAFHQTASSENGEGAYLSMTQAIAQARLTPQDIQYVNAHGTGTPNNDQSESVAMQRVFGTKMPFVSSTKGFTGHATSAAGALEAVISILALSHQFVPANIGWSKPMAEGITPSEGEAHAEIRNVVCNSFGFGGNDTSIVFSTPQPSTLNSQPSTLNPQPSTPATTTVEITDDAQLKEISNYVKPLEARRMGKLLKSTLLASMKALEKAGVGCPDAIITATAYGCLENSAALLRQMNEEGETSISPTRFMQSTHNTIGSNIGIRLHCHGYNTTYTQGERSMECALLDARMLLKEGKCKTVLVVAGDDPLNPSTSQPINPTKAIVLSCGE